MDIQTASLPSCGWKSNLPPQFEMRMFEGPETALIAKAIETKDMRYILLDALEPCLNVPIQDFTIPDAYALAFQQRMFLNDIKPLTTYWTCSKPLYEYSDGIKYALNPEGGLINTFPCDHRNVGVVDETSMIVEQLVANHEQFDLPRMLNYERATVDMFGWHVAHMGRRFNDGVNKLESQTDLKLWMELSEWVLAARHGLLSDIKLYCPACARHSTRTWEMTPAIFL